MNIIVKEELKAYIDPLTPEEHEALERSILAEGCRDALVLWGEVLVDGHNRYGICQKHGLPFQTIQHPHFKSMEDVHLWMIDQHLGRRSVSDFQRGVLALRKKEILAERRARKLAESAEQLAASPGEPAAIEAADDAPWEGQAELPPVPALNTREAVARAARLSAAQVQQIEKIQKNAAPELVAAVRAGTVSLNTAATVAALPVQEQQAAVAAGKEEIKQAAKRVRQAKARSKDPAAEGGEGSADKLNSAGLPPVTAESATEAQIKALQARVAELEAENAALRGQLAALQA